MTCAAGRSKLDGFRAAGRCPLLGCRKVLVNCGAVVLKTIPSRLEKATGSTAGGQSPLQSKRAPSGSGALKGNGSACAV